MITAERLKEVLHYNPETGDFHWKIRRGRQAKGTLAGCLDDLGYIRIRIDSVLYLAHRLAWLYMYGTLPLDEIDHKDLNPTNNILTNLRLANHSQNSQNRRIHMDCISDYKGVTYENRTGRWFSRICVNNQKIHLGTFDTAEEAAKAYNKAAEKFHNEYARLNIEKEVELGKLY